MKWLWRSLGKLGHPAASSSAQALYSGYTNGFKTAHRMLFNPDRMNVYGRDWDVLVVLDACRYDLISEVADEYDFVSDIESIQSVGSASDEWMENTFNEASSELVSNTAYITGNIKSHEQIDPDDFKLVDEVWKYAWDDDLGTIPPRPITDRAISTWRDETVGRMIVHYMQPHFPSITQPDIGSAQVPDLSGGEWESVSAWNELRVGNYERAEVWQAYADNLRAVLEDVELLLGSISADTVVITSDHGNAMGEWGFYDHPGYHPLDVLRTVPWIQTSAERNLDYDPAQYDQSSKIGRDSVEARLRSLGYTD